MSQREYQRLTGEPEDSETAGKMKEFYEHKVDPEPFKVKGKIQESYEETGLHPDIVLIVRESLESIDFEGLEGLFADIASRSGVPKDQVNFLGKDRIFLSRAREGGLTKDPGGCYNVLQNTIEVFPQIMVHDIARRKITNLIKRTGRMEFSHHETTITDEEVRLFTLDTLIHEQVHAISFSRVLTEHPKNFFVRLAKKFAGKRGSLPELAGLLSGYNRQLLETKPNGDLGVNTYFVAFDEGVTQKMTFEILKKYLASNPAGISSDLVRQFEEETLQGQVYGGCIQIVDQIISRVAKLTNMSDQAVWRAIVRSKIEGVDLEKAGIGVLLDDSVFKGFFAELKKLRVDDPYSVIYLMSCIELVQ